MLLHGVLRVGAHASRVPRVREEKITVAFMNLTQDGWGNRAPGFRPDTVFSVQFNIAAPQSVFDVWVDDVESANRSVADHPSGMPSRRR